MATSTRTLADLTEILENEEVGCSANADYAATSKKKYIRLLEYGNVTSYSTLSELHRCPRLFQLMKQRAKQRMLTEGTEENLNFAFGHAVGAGAQSWLKDGNKSLAMFNAFMAWSAAFDDRDYKAGKSIWEANLAVEKFIAFAASALEDWEILILPNGKAAVETSFSFHAERGNRHYGHMDIAFRNRRSGRIAVGEFKTSKYKEAEEAFYANSSQGVSYATLLETLYPGLVEYEVLYMVYSSTAREWQLLPFVKTVKHKAEWIKDLLMDHANIELYERLRFYPKRGESCYNFNRRCQFFGDCDEVGTDKFPLLPENEEAEEPDFVLTLADVINTQKARNEE